MCDFDIDISNNRPLRIGVVLNEDVLWDGDTAPERIRGGDLRGVAREAARTRRALPDVDVVVDIDVVIAPDSGEARVMFDAEVGESCGATMLYVGTPSGLVGLVTDIHALGIVDGAVLIPRAAGVADLIRDAVLPLLDTVLRLPAAPREARPA